MLNLQLRVVNDNGTVNSATSRVLPTAEIVYTSAINTPSGLTFKVSRDDFVPAQFPFVVRVEKSVNGGDYSPTTQNSLFVVEKDSDDSKDVGKIVTYEAVGFVTWLVQGALHNWHSSAKNNTRTWYEGNKGPASAGYTLHGMLNESKNAGWFPMLTWNFNGTRDSGGNNWVAADKTITAWELSLNLTTILDQMTDDGLCEWTTAGTGLRMYRMGKMGVDRPDTVVGGRGFTSVPVRTDATGLYSHIRAVPDKLPWQNFTSDTTLRNRFGHRSIVLSQSGINTVAASAKNAQSYIEAGKEVVREESYDWVPTADLPHPWVDFDLGDQVTAHSRGGKQLRRVVALSVNQTGRDPAEVNLRVGKFIKSRAAKLKDRLDSVAVGGIIGGSGAGMPLSPGPRNTIPAAPIGVRVTSNTAEWLEDGRALSSVTVDWDAVTAAEDGSEIDVVEYEVWSRAPYETLSRDIATRDTEVTISSWASGRDRLIAVRAKSDLGDWSDFSTEFLITPAIPVSIIPKAPEAVAATTNVGSWSATGPMSTIKLTITPVTESTDDIPITIKEYEIWVDGNPVMRTPTPSATLTQPAGAVRDYRARALSTLDVWGDLSPTISVSGNLPPVSTRTPTAPVLTTGAGNAFARWDGGYTGSGSTAGAHRVDVEARIGTGSWAAQGTLVGAGQQIVTLGAIGDAVEVRLRAFDQLGRLTGTSAAATITVQGVERSDLDQEVNDFLADLEGKADNAWDAASSAVKNTIVQYAVGSSETVAPTTGWSTNTPVRTPGTFVWMRSVITFGDDTTSTTSAALITGNAGSNGADGSDGTDGTDGRGITSTAVTYQASNSGTATPTGSWSSTVPAVSAGQYLWTRTIITYTDSTTSTSYSVGRSGTNGTNGTPGTKGADGQTSYLHVAYANNATGTVDFSPDDPSGRAYMGTYTDFTEGDSPDPSKYLWSLIKGADGATGSTGPAGKGISSSAVTYQGSSSGTTEPTGSWSSTVPTVAAGQFLWTRTVINFTDGATTTAYAVARMGVNGAKGDPGASGATGVGVSSVTQFYYVTAATAGAPAKPTVLTPPSPWSVTEPAFQPNTALWAVTRVVYTNNTFAYSEVSKVSAYTASVLADGKLTLATSAPTVAQGTGKPAGALWMVKTGTAFSAMYEWSGTAWAIRPLAETIIPKVAIGTGTYGELSGNRLSAHSIEANKLLVGDFTDRFPDPTFSDPRGYGSWTRVGNTLEKNGTGSQNGTYFLPSAFPARGGEEFYVRFDRTNIAGSTGQSRLYVQYATNEAGTNFTNVPNGHGSPITAPTAGGTASGVIKAPVGTTALRIGYYTEADMPTTVRVSHSAPEIRRRNGGELIVDGTIHANKLDVEEIWGSEAWLNVLRAGVIEVDMVTPNFGETINLNGNVSIQPIIERQDAQDNVVAGVIGDVENAQKTADAAAQTASDAQAEINTLAEGRVLTAEQALDVLSGKIDDYENSFSFEADGLHIREATTASAELVLTSAGARLNADGVTVSEWNQGQFIVANIHAAGGQIGHHIIDSSIAGHTTFRLFKEA